MCRTADPSATYTPVIEHVVVAGSPGSLSLDIGGETYLLINAKEAGAILSAFDVAEGEGLLRWQCGDLADRIKAELPDAEHEYSEMIRIEREERRGGE